jgi:dolichol kinase
MRHFAVSVPRPMGTRVNAQQLAVSERDRSFPHLSRKLYHALMGLICFSLYAFVLDRTQALWILALVGGPWAFLDLLRLRLPKLNEAALKVFGPVMRKDEINRASGNTFYVLGLLAVVIFLPKPIALLSILYLAIGDPAAAIIGTMWGRRKIPGTRKSVEGGLGNFALCFVATVLFSTLYLGLAFDHSLLFGLIGGLIAMLVEALPLPFDDNFSIPTLAGGLLWALTSLFPLMS